MPCLPAPSIRTALATLAASIAAIVPAHRASAQRVPSSHPQEILRGDLPFSQERGEVQITTGAIVGRRPSRIAVPLSIEYGVSGVWQIGGELDGAWGDREPGQRALTGASLGVQRSWTPIGGTRTHVGIGLEGEYETERSATWPSWTPHVAVARELGARGAQAFAQASMSLARGTPRPTLMAGAFAPVGRAFVVAQVTRDAGEGGEPARTALTPGLVMQLFGAELLGGASIPMTGGTSAAGAILKFTVEF